MQNLKVDIIYHQSPSDFEMEFNLGSCCHMRLLSDRTTDKKSFIKALVRDVARSRVIMCCGPLFGDDGLISIVSRAISAGTTLCDNKTYGINSDVNIDIIAGSTPLVTPDGYFGGCIIESGPQTIVLLTENRTFRKVIMKNLIHPYLQEISYIAPVSHVIPTPQPAQEVTYDAAVTEEETYLTQTDDEYYNDELQQEGATAKLGDEHNIEFIMDGEEAIEEETEKIAQDDAQLKLYTAIETKEEMQSRYEKPYTTSESDQMFIANSECGAVQKKVKKDKKRKIDIAIVILVLLLLLAALALVYLMVLRPMSMGLDIGEYIKEIFDSASGNALV